MPVAFHADHAVDGAARPVHDETVDGPSISESERCRKFALREIARSGTYASYHAQVAHAGFYARGEAVATALSTFQADAKVAGAAVSMDDLVSPQVHPAVVFGNEDIEITVVVVVGIGRTAGHQLPGHHAPQEGRRIGERAGAVVQVEMRGLLVSDVVLDALDLGLYVAVCSEEIQVAVEVEVCQEESERERPQRRASDLRGRGAIDKQTITQMPVDADHLGRKVADEDGYLPRAVYHPRVDAHAGARLPAFVVRNPAQRTFLRERAVPVVDVEEVSLRVIGDHQVRPAVPIEIQLSNSQRLSGRRIESCLFGRVLECTGAVVAVEPAGDALVGFRRTVSLADAVERTVDVGLGGPDDVISDVEVQVAVAVGVEEDGRGTPYRFAGYAGLSSRFREGAVSVICEKQVFAQGRKIDVAMSVAVIIPHGEAEAVGVDAAEAGLLRNVRERAVAVVAVHPEGPPGGRLAFGPPAAAGEEDILQPVAVEIDEGYAGAHGFRKPLLPESARIVLETGQARGFRDVGKGKRINDGIAPIPLVGRRGILLTSDRGKRSGEEAQCHYSSTHTSFVDRIPRARLIRSTASASDDNCRRRLRRVALQVRDGRIAGEGSR